MSQQPGWSQQPGQQYGASPGQPPRQGTDRIKPAKKRRRWPWVIGAVVVLFVVIAAVNAGKDKAPTATEADQTITPAAAAPAPTLLAATEQGGPAAPAPAAAAPAGDPDQITYEVIGDGVSKANNITYIKDDHMGQQQANGVKLPWTKTVTIPDTGFRPLSLVAQSGSAGNGKITCRVKDGTGKVLTESTSEGQYAVVTCSA